jgi:bacterioferritin (cytochrome b1)
MSTKEKQEALVENMKQWQKIENAAIFQTAKIMEQTEHPLIRAVAEIIQRDSHMHYRIQQLIVDSLEKEAVPVLIDQLSSVWETIEKHIQIEKQTIEMAQACLQSIEGTRNVVQQYLLNYLLEDERKHDKLLSDLDLIKKKMYP